jgi:hypothetical protein
MRHAILVAAWLATAATLACSAPVRPYACAVDPQISEVDVDVHTVWTCNRDVLRRASRNKKFSLREFRGAVAFFQELTGLRVDTRASHLGAIPGRDLSQDVRDLDAWYELNKNKLNWDAGLSKIVFAGLAPTLGGG